MAPPAKIELRILAYLIDVIPIVVGVTVVFFVFFGLDDAFRERIESPNDPDVRAKFLAVRNDARNVSFILVILYGMIMEGTPLQGTLGKLACGMKVVDAEGERLSVLHSVYRNLSKLVSYFVV
ncbi:MAG: RDD family protein, partial [Planctomycetota bacterium]